MAKRKTQFACRICAICGKPGADLGYRTALRWLGCKNWQLDKAHTACIKKLQKETA